MKEIICNSVYFGVTISILSYILGVQLKKKFGWGLLNPLLVSIVLVISFLLIFEIDFEAYDKGAKYLSYFLTPATVLFSHSFIPTIRITKEKFKSCNDWYFSRSIIKLW